MPLLIAKWPNDTLTIIRAPVDWDALWLFDELDQEGDPCCSKVFIVRGERAHIGWCWDGGSIQPEVYGGSLKEWPWPADTLDRHYAEVLQRAADIRASRAGKDAAQSESESK